MSDLELHSWATPNGHKVHIMLAELAVPYDLRPVNIFKGEQLTEAFRALNPNGRIPVLVDRSVAHAAPLRIFESGAILLHLADRFGRFIPQSPVKRSEAVQWLMWQIAGLGPMLGQAQHFVTYAGDEHPYAIERYVNEGARLLAVMDLHLSRHEYLADEYSVADIACFPWVRIHKLAGLSLEERPHLRRWYGAVRARPAVGAGLDVLREVLTGVPKEKEAHEVMFGKSQFRNLS